jgi:hypothetical protein
MYKMHKIMRERLFKVHKGAGAKLCKPNIFVRKKGALVSAHRKGGFFGFYLVEWR